MSIPKLMTPQDAIARLRQMKADQDEGEFDEEGQHTEGDAILCAVLRCLAYDNVADAWEAVSGEWWYA